MNIDTDWTADEYDAAVKGAISFILHRDPAKADNTINGTVAISNITDVLNALGINETRSMGNLISLIDELVRDDDVEVVTDFGIEFMASNRYLERQRGTADVIHLPPP